VLAHTQLRRTPKKRGAVSASNLVTVSKLQIGLHGWLRAPS
jgi:hypothetical protein